VNRGDGAGSIGSPPLVVLENITKRFPGVLANDGVNLDLRPGEVHALIGENGAGKSTLMRILYGIYPAEDGRIEVRGQEAKIGSPRDAIALGIGMVHQHFVLVDPFTVTENIILGEEGGALLDLDAAQQRVVELADSYGFRVDPKAVVEDLSVGEEQRVEILKALYRGVEILILDEPTAVLTPSETQDLFGNLRKLREAGRTIVFISHKLDEVLEIADRITVLRRGRVVGETTPAETTKAKLAEMMVGRPVLFRLDKPDVEIGDAVVRVDGIEGEGKLNGVSFEVRAGEILGVAGVEGNGQRELAETLIGLRMPAAGTIELEGTSITGRSVEEIRNAGVGYIPEDRHEQGLVLTMTVWENAALGRQDDPEFSNRFGILFIKKIKALGAKLIQLFDVRARSVDVSASTLSGGEPAEADPRARARAGSEVPDRRAAHARARRRRDRVRVEADPGSEGCRTGRAADFGRARRDLRALRSHRHVVRGQDHRRVPARRPARAGRGGHARRRRSERRRNVSRVGRTGRGWARVMAVNGMAAPAAATRSRPAWLESFVGQALALIVAFGIAVAAGSLLILAYGESPVEVYSSILEASVGSADGIGYVLSIATPLIFSALAVAVCFKGGMFNIGVEGQYFVGMLTAAWAVLSLTSCPARSSSRSR
jgi:simple sugar transport system ATP-binding protein